MMTAKQKNLRRWCHGSDDIHDGIMVTVTEIRDSRTNTTVNIVGVDCPHLNTDLSCEAATIKGPGAGNRCIFLPGKEKG